MSSDFSPAPPTKTFTDKTNQICIHNRSKIYRYINKFKAFDGQEKLDTICTTMPKIKPEVSEQDPHDSAKEV